MRKNITSYQHTGPKASSVLQHLQWQCWLRHLCSATFLNRSAAPSQHLFSLLACQGILAMISQQLWDLHEIRNTRRV